MPGENASDCQAACTGARHGREEAQRRGRSGSASSASDSGSSASDSRSGGGGQGAAGSGLGDDALSDMLSKRIVRRVADPFTRGVLCLFTLLWSMAAITVSLSASKACRARWMNGHLQHTLIGASHAICHPWTHGQQVVGTELCHCRGVGALRLAVCHSRVPPGARYF